MLQSPCIAIREAKMTELAHLMTRSNSLSEQREENMPELAHLVTKYNTQLEEQRRNKLKDAVSGIPPAKLQQELAAALETDKERRLELKAKVDELPTEELERLLSISAQRAS